MVSVRLFIFTTVLVSSTLGALPEFASAEDVPQSFTLDGRLFSDPQGTTPLEDALIRFKVQILDEAETCVLYEEEQNVNTATSKGYFSIRVGSAVGSTRRTTDDSSNTMATIFQNIAATNGKLLSNGNSCAVPAVAGKRRFVRVTVSPTSLGGADRVLTPNLTIDSVPNAIVAERAESLQGLRGSDVLKIKTDSGSVLSQTNLESLFTSVTRFNSLSAVVDGTSSSYVQSSANGARLPVIAGAPSTPAQGSIWFDTGDNRLKFFDGTDPITLSSGGPATGVSAADGNAGAPSISFSADTNTGIYRITNDILGFSTNGTERMRINGSGNVGLGAITPTTILDINGAMTFRATTQPTATAAQGKIYYDTALDKFRVSQNGGAYVDLLGGSGSVTNVTGTLPISVATGTTTPVISIATADASTTGALTDSDWELFNAKLSSPLTTKGDLLTHSSTTHVRLPVGTDGQVVVADAAQASGLRWTNFSVGNLRTAGGAAQFASASCAATQTLTWSSLTNTFTCTNIAGLDGAVITTGTLDSARLPARALYWSEAVDGIHFSDGNVGVGTSEPGFALSVGDGTSNDGGIIARGYGAVGTGTTLGLTGAGKKLIWHPRKAAFRAGSTNGAEWNDANIGNWSVALGNSSTASGAHSVALGSLNTASGVYATAIGNGATASGMGAISLITGNAIGDWSLASGMLATSDSFLQTSFGRYNMPKGGESATTWVATDPLFVIGNGSGSGASRSTAMMVLKNGNVGIRTTTASTALDLAGAMTFRATAEPAATADQGKIYYDTALNKFRVSQNGGAYTDLIGSGGGGDFLADGSAAMTGALRAINGSLSAPGLTFTNDTTTGIYLPGAGSLAITAASSPKVQFNSAGIVPLTHTRPSIFGTAGAPAYSFLYDNDTGIYSGGNNSNVLAFSTAGVERLRMDSSGNLGIGTTTPDARLDVTDASTTTSAIIVPRAGNFTGTNVNGMVRYNTASTLFEFYQNGAWVNYTTVSDGRLKTNIAPVNNGLDIVNQLNPVFYDWDRSNPKASAFENKHQVGFIAQDVEKILPEVVNKGEDSYRSLEYGKIVSVVVAAIKEVHIMVQNLETENVKLKVEADKQRQENIAIKSYLCTKDPEAVFCK